MRSPSFALIVATLFIAPPAAAQMYLSANGPSDVWVTNDGGMVAHYTGQGWTGMKAANASIHTNAIWAPGPQEAWLVGNEGLILHLSGGAWSYVRAPVRRDFVAVGGCGANDVWVVGQSNDESRPPVLLHYDGQAWTRENAPVPFRAAGIATTCPGGMTIAGATFFDPRPDQRRNAGVLLRRSGGAWTARGWDGHAMNDQQLGGASWTGLSSCGSAMLLEGQNESGGVLLRSTGGAFAPVPAATVNGLDPRELHYGVSCDGTPLVAFEKGFGRLVNGQWVITSAESNQAGGMSASNSAAFQALMMRVAEYGQRGQAPPKAMMDSVQQMQTGMVQASSNAMANMQRAQGLSYGRDATPYAVAPGLFYVTGGSGVFRVRGDSSTAVWSPGCWQMATLPQCQANAARGAAVPTAAAGEPPEAPEDSVNDSAPAPQQPNRPRVAVPRPRVRIP